MIGTTNISTDLVKATLSESTDDVGTLCSSNNVNLFSKWKPIKHPKDFDLLESDLAGANYGIIIAQDFMNTVSWMAGRVWTWDKPTGGDASEYRLDDFRNYEHSSVQPFAAHSGGTITVTTNPGNTTFTLNQTTNVAGSVRYTDLKVGTGTPIANCYFGIVVTRLSDDVVVLVKTSSSTIGAGSGSATVTCDFAEIETDDYKIAFFISTWILSTQLTNPASNQLPTAEFYILHNDVVSYSIINNLSSIIFPYTFWIYTGWGQFDTEFSSESYTVTTTNSTSIVNTMGTVVLVIPSSNPGKMILAPKAFMDDFPSLKKEMILEITENGTQDYTTQAEKHWMLLKWFDVDYLPTIVYVRAKWDSLNSEWDFYLGIANDGISIGESYFGTGTIGSQLQVDKITVSSGGGSSDTVVSVFKNSEGSAAVSINNIPSPINLDNIEIGGGDFFENGDFNTEYGDYLPASYHFNYYSPSL